MMKKICIHWMRRDIRLEDNAALWMALRSGFPVLVVFIFDRNILDKLSDRHDARVMFIYRELQAIKAQLEKLGSSLKTYYGTPTDAFKQLLTEYDVQAVFTNRDYEPYARERDKQIYDLLSAHGVVFKGAKDHVIFEKEEVLKEDGKPYTVYTPYSRKWKQKINAFYVKSYPTEKYHSQFFTCPPIPMPTMEQMGFKECECDFPSRQVSQSLIDGYEKTRDIPAIRGTSRLSLHLRFGTVSIRKMAQLAQKSKSDKWLNELIWRDFYQMILYHFPHTVQQSFKPQYDRIEWLNDTQQFARWCAGTTGYPLVDAGMRELNATGFMHNRVRMVVASFLTKHLLIDWRWGEQYFAQKLLDYECASNVGGWQWAAGSGCDAAPYFRIFNPESQAEKFDPDWTYIRHWVPEVNSASYPPPLVDHKFARERCLAAFKKALA